MGMAHVRRRLWERFRVRMTEQEVCDWADAIELQHVYTIDTALKMKTPSLRLETTLPGSAVAVSVIYAVQSRDLITVFAPGTNGKVDRIDGQKWRSLTKNYRQTKARYQYEDSHGGEE